MEENMKFTGGGEHGIQWWRTTWNSLVEENMKFTGGGQQGIH